MFCGNSTKMIHSQILENCVENHNQTDKKQVKITLSKIEIHRTNPKELDFI